MKNNVIDFRSRQPKAEAPAPNRTPQYVVEFFDDPDFPFRFKGVEPTPDFLRKAARGCANACLGLLAIAHSKDGDDSQLPRLVAYLFHDGQMVVDCFNPPAFDGPEAYDWMMRVAPPALLKVLRETKEAQCSPTR